MSASTTAVVITPDHPDYAAASTVFMGSGAPARVVRVHDAAQVAEAVRYAVEHDLLVSVRSGGHSALAFGTNHGGLVIDLSGIDSVEVLDADTGQVRIGGGATWGPVADILAKDGLALTSGDTRSVGVGGLTLGGGIGWMVRNHGLTIDSLIAADVVTAAGDEVRASVSSHPELFWAIRGGGGNFGVVTHFEFIAQRVTQVHAGVIGYPIDDVRGLVSRWAAAMAAATEELNATLVLAPPMGPDLPPGAVCLLCYAGDDAAAAEAAIAPLREIAPVTMEAVSPKPYVEVLEEARAMEGMRVSVGNTMVTTLGDEMAAAIEEFYAGGTVGRVTFIRALGGAMSRVPADATAFAHRRVAAMVVGAALVPEPTSDEATVEALLPFGAVREHGFGCYAGFVGSATEDDLAELYPAETYERLVAVKRRYDPSNVFSQNFNIRP